MSEHPLWRCGHPRTAENTLGEAKGQCRECNRRRNRESYRRLSPSERYDRYRRKCLPDQIQATEHKLRALCNEAARLGLIDMLPERQA